MLPCPQRACIYGFDQSRRIFDRGLPQAYLVAPWWLPLRLAGSSLRLTCSSLHRCLQRHGISRLPRDESNNREKKKFKAYPMGFFHIDIAEVRTDEGKLYLFLSIDRTSKFVMAKLTGRATMLEAQALIEELVAAVPYNIHTICWYHEKSYRSDGYVSGTSLWSDLSQVWYRTSSEQTESSLDEWSGRTDEQDTVKIPQSIAIFIRAMLVFWVTCNHLWMPTILPRGWRRYEDCPSYEFIVKK